MDGEKVFFLSIGSVFVLFFESFFSFIMQYVYFQRYEVLLQSRCLHLRVGGRVTLGGLGAWLFDGGESPGVVHRMKVANMDGVEQLEWAAEHLLP